MPAGVFPAKSNSPRAVYSPSKRPRALLRAHEVQRGAGPSSPRAEALLVELGLDFERLLGVVILAGKPLKLVLQGEVKGHLNDFLCGQSRRPPQSSLVNFLFRHDRLFPPRSRSAGRSLRFQFIVPVAA